MCSIIEKELLRESLFKQIVTKIKLYMKGMNISNYPDAAQMLMRYIINKIPFRKETDDPVFITSKSILSERQIELDYKYFNISLESKPGLLALLEVMIYRSADIMSSNVFPKDKKVKKSKMSMYYAETKLYDNRGLSRINIQYAFALQKRYRYFFNHRNFFSISYEQFKLNKLDKNFAESFVNSFTHYFREFAGFFPDLETVFGSHESLFDYDNWTAGVIFLNPPHDQVFIENMIIEVLKSVKKTFMIYIPFWFDIEKIQELKKRANDYSLFTKGELKGKNRFSNTEVTCQHEVLLLVIHPVNVHTVIIPTITSTPVIELKVN